MRKNISTARTTGNTNSNGIPGGEIAPIKNAPNKIIAAMIKNTTIEPSPHTSGCLLFPMLTNYSKINILLNDW
jgi:hypothetical protein